jgi:hypothetical protein
LIWIEHVLHDCCAESQAQRWKGDSGAAKQQTLSTFQQFLVVKRNPFVTESDVKKGFFFLVTRFKMESLAVCMHHLNQPWRPGLPAQAVG